MVSIRRLSLFLVMLVLLAVLVISASAQDDSVTDNEVNVVARDIYCPVCESTPLDVCPTQACADWRELIRAKLAAGESREQIFDYFARQYGDGVLANPPRRGISLVLLWVFPIVILLLGFLLFSRTMRSLRRADQQTAGVSVSGAISSGLEAKPARDDYLARIEEELENSRE